jgi:hypothetical protein
MNKTKYILITIIIAAVMALTYILPLTIDYDFTENYRIPHSMNEDYYLYKKYSKHVSSTDLIQVIGDSVIWGHYVDKDNTLTAHLNKTVEAIDPDLPHKKFMNMGLEGIFPAAMTGLIEKFSAGLKNKKIIVGFNLLWISSSKHDLSGEAENNINHKRLLPQVYPKIPAYNPNIEERLSAIISRSMPLILIEHIKMNRFREKNFYLWTMDHPHNSIINYFSGTSSDIYSPPPVMKLDHTDKQNINWTDLDKSVQWEFMLKTLIRLKKNKNDIFILITPFNTYMITDESSNKYYSIISNIREELTGIGMNFIIPEIHEKNFFADSSHFTSEGYRFIAESILNNDEFKKFIINRI